jgi:hypothetical protein
MSEHELHIKHNIAYLWCFCYFESTYTIVKRITFEPDSLYPRNIYQTFESSQVLTQQQFLNQYRPINEIMYAKG